MGNKKNLQGCQFIWLDRKTVLLHTSMKLEKTLFLIQPTLTSLKCYLNNYQSAINYYFEEIYDPNYCITDYTWTLFDDFFTYHSVPNISIKAARPIKSTEELLISYEKPPPEILTEL